MAIFNVTSIDLYKQFLSSSNLCVLHFSAPWAEQCKQMNELIDSMTKLAQYKEIKFGQIIAEDVPEVSFENNITAVPTMILFVKAKNVARVDGAKPEELEQKIKKYLLCENGTKAEQPDLESRLQSLINEAPCMLFMKGNRKTPRCGFSRQIISLLDEHNADYKTFDILEDNEVREGLKKFSNWPTYPQLYINGELIGGLDIVKEMSESGELESMLPKSATATLESKLRSLINRAPCMLFMKGNRNSPRCGFSKSMIALLNEQNVDYQTFDILEDNDVREGLKTYSNWPTYPQLYINGELMGGLDVIKEMVKTGELNEMLPKTNK